MITRVKSTVFTNKKTVGSYANIAFDTYIELGGGKEDVLSVDKRWGYFSDKDNRMDHFDLCEACYDELTGSFKIKLEEE